MCTRLGLARTIAGGREAEGETGAVGEVGQEGDELISLRPTSARSIGRPLCEGVHVHPVPKAVEYDPNHHLFDRLVCCGRYVEVAWPRELSRLLPPRLGRPCSIRCSQKPAGQDGVRTSASDSISDSVSVSPPVADSLPAAAFLAFFFSRFS